MIDETLPALAPLTKLTRLGASMSGITGASIAALRGCTEMRSLNFGYDTPISPEGLAMIAATFPTLEELSVGNGARLKAEDFRGLAGLKRLKYLGTGLPSLNDDALPEIARISSLESFYSNQGTVTATGITALQSLKFLSKLKLVDCKNIDDTAISPLKDLKTLRELEIKGTTITDAGFEALKKALPQCVVTR